ncbi:MAG: aminotransferase class V-fold PLP-dependent enzyme [Bacteroidales bacterium]|nr:aminotransferase class V-fold PLP-dependent enzyme [Bacteroidales bacterium]
MYSFDSDYLEGCVPEILDALASTNLEQTPGYGMDPYCREAADLIRNACSAPGAEVFFLEGGTQTNATVIASILKPYQGALCASTAHIAVHETGAIEHGGHKVLALPCGADGKINSQQVRKAVLDHNHDVHCVQPGMVYISQPTEVGAVYSVKELSELSDACRECGLPLYVDGARLGYALASPLCDVSLEDLAALTDVFYIGGTKQGALFGEAVVFGNTSLAEDFRYCIKQNGGMMAKGRLLGLQFKTLFTGNLYVEVARGAVQKALQIRDAFLAAGYEMLSESPTNQQFVILPNDVVASLRRNFSFEDWIRIDEGHTAVRFCTSWATPQQAVDELKSAIPALQNLS